ncbi:MAG: SRPBCC domain-containing protein [Bacteroidetes bacterium]|nr:SRPBCC domain-containing protein [Bacteroidota bacterium]
MEVSPKTFTITRTLNAPRQLVWDVWTQPDHLMKWFAPKGFIMPKCDMDFRVGGTFHYCQESPSGEQMWGKWIFREIVKPEKIDLLHSFSDAEGGITHHPMAPTWPLQMTSVTTLVDNAGKTDLTIAWSPYNASDEEITTFNSSFDSMNGGWNGTFEYLEAYLSELTK